MNEQEIKNQIGQTINNYFEVYEVYLKNRSEKAIKIWEQDDRDTFVNWIYDAVVKDRKTELLESELMDSIIALIDALSMKSKTKKLLEDTLHELNLLQGLYATDNLKALPDFALEEGRGAFFQINHADKIKEINELLERTK